MKDISKIAFKKSHIEIINLFKKNIFLSKTIREISLTLNKDYPTIYNAIKELADKNILNTKEVGKSKVCELNLNMNSISVLSFLDEQEAISKNIPNMDKILNFKEFLDDILLITGSYAESKETKKSDIDLVIITKENAFQKQKLAENLTYLFLPRIHVIVITQKDFMDMLRDKKANFGKEIFNKRLIFRNAQRYYELLKEAIENGFRN